MSSVANVRRSGARSSGARSSGARSNGGASGARSVARGTGSAARGAGSGASGAGRVESKAKKVVGKAKGAYLGLLKKATSFDEVVQAMTVKTTVIGSKPSWTTAYFNDIRCDLGKGKNMHPGFWLEQVGTHVLNSINGLKKMLNLKDKPLGEKVAEVFGKTKDGGDRKFDVLEVGVLLKFWLNALDDALENPRVVAVHGADSIKMKKKMALIHCVEWTTLLIELEVPGNYYEVLDDIIGEAIELKINERTDGEYWSQLIELVEIADEKGFLDAIDDSDGFILDCIVGLFKSGQDLADAIAKRKPITKGNAIAKRRAIAKRQATSEWNALGVEISLGHYKGKGLPDYIFSKGDRHQKAFVKAMVLLGACTDVVKIAQAQIAEGKEEA